MAGGRVSGSQLRQRKPDPPHLGLVAGCLTHTFGGGFLWTLHRSMEDHRLPRPDCKHGVETRLIL